MAYSLMHGNRRPPHLIMYYKFLVIININENFGCTNYINCRNEISLTQHKDSYLQPGGELKRVVEGSLKELK